MNTRDLIGLVIDLGVSQENRVPGGEGAQNVSGFAIVERIDAASERLAIQRNDRQHFSVLPCQQAFGMRAQSRFKAVAIKRVQQDAHGVDGRRSLQIDTEHLVERIQSLLHKNDDIAETFGSRQNRQNRKQEEIGQRVALSLITSRIRNLL